MAETKSENIYTIPLRRHWLIAPQYKRTRKAIIAIKEYVAKHMKVPERNLDKVKVNMFLNNEIWFRGSKNPPAKIKVKVVKVNDLYKVDFAEVPKIVEFAKKKAEKRNIPKETKQEEKSAEEASQAVQATQEKTEELKKEEKEKEQSVAIAKERDIKQEIKAEKHTTKAKDNISKRKSFTQKAG